MLGADLLATVLYWTVRLGSYLARRARQPVPADRVVCDLDRPAPWRPMQLEGVPVYRIGSLPDPYDADGPPGTAGVLAPTAPRPMLPPLVARVSVPR